MRTPSEQDHRAIVLAEAFVFSNGYTLWPPSIPFEQLTLELWDGTMTQEQVLAYRHNYLETHAIGFLRDDDGWLIVFKATEAAVSSRQDIFPFSPIGRYVHVNKKFQVSALTHAWADPSDPDMIRLSAQK